MDEKKLKDVLSNLDIPKPSENARKRALNMAMAEFEAHQGEKTSNNFQGNSFLSRLMGKSTGQQQRRDPMELHSRKKLLYGVMGTAAAVAIITGISFTQLQDYASKSDVNMNIIGEARPDSVKSKHSPIIEMEMAEEVYSDSTTSSGAIPMPTLAVPEIKGELNKQQKARSDMAYSAAPQALRASPATSPAITDGLTFTQEQIMPYPVPQDVISRDKFAEFTVNPVKLVQEEPVSTFSVDVDTASYSFIRRELNRNNRLPNPAAVRVEEMINYFDYNYPLPETRDQPFKPTVTLVDSPFNAGKQLMHIGIKGFDIQGEHPKTNLVFLLDVSGSMNSADKLPLVKDSMKMLLDSLQPADTVAIAVYAGAAGTVLEPTPVSERTKIYEALNSLSAGGSTAGGAGINLAYSLAEQNFDSEAVNRVILATDGDFNVGVSNHEQLKTIIEQKRKKGIFLSVLGFGQGNLNDQLMQTLAQNGNGIAAYIDNINEARKVLIDEATSTLFPIAKDVKIQVEFNPAQVTEYRLIGYETRALNREDFNNDKIDAGDIGAGHTVTAIYEITPVGSSSVSVDPLRYGSAVKPETFEKTTEKTKANTDFGNEIAFLKMRYKLPNEDVSKLITTPISTDNYQLLVNECANSSEPALCDLSAPLASDDVRFSIAVAGFGQLLKNSTQIGNFTYDDVIELANDAKGDDRFGYRHEFINLVRNAKIFASR